MTDQKVDALSLDDDSVNGSIKLISKDGREFSVEKRFAFISNLVKTSMDSGMFLSKLSVQSVQSIQLSER